jgi:hypothetical protein
VNCLLGALVIQRRFGGKINWRPGWKQAGWRSFVGNPWGHFRVILSNGTILSYSSSNKELPAWNQLWFRGYIKRVRRCK